MFDKILASVNNNVQEIVITLQDSCLDKILYYRDEGNMNIVLSLYAQENDDKYVIRFKKIFTDVTEQTFNDHKHELMSFIHFEELLQKYFDHFTVVPKIAFVDVDLSALNEFLMRDRPAVRRKKVIGSNYGLLYRDVAFLPKQIYTGKPLNGELKDSSTMCIEIKVKQGYIMSDDVKFGVRKCRYCYFQYLKLATSKISHISSYCPIDLFSGNAQRMYRAIKGLFENPQNNLKMFQDGKMVYNEYSPDKSSLNRMMKSLFPDVKTADKQEILIINLIRMILLKDFARCDKNKNNINQFDVSTGYECPENVHMRSCASDNFTELPKNCILSSILKAQQLVRENFANMEFFEKDQSVIECSKGYDRILQDYRMGSTALDCSVMITFRKINGENFDNDRDNLIDKKHYLKLIGPTGNAQHFVVNATVVDLDEKKDALAHFRKYKRQYEDSKVEFFEFIKSIKNID